MVSENPKADRTVTIHGDEWKINDITDAVAWALTQVWRREAWKASPALIDKSGANSNQYTGQSFDASKTDLVHDGWTHDHCPICWWALHETDNEDEGEGYCNQDNVWLCSECYCQFIRVDSLNLKAAANNAVNPSGGLGGF